MATALQHTLSSQLGSAVSTFLIYPLDVVRIRYVSQDSTHYRQHNQMTYTSMRKSFAVIFREEGIRTFFRGVHVAIVGSVCAWGVYMALYRWLSEVYASYRTKGHDLRRSTVNTFLERSGLSILSSSISAVVCCPIWVLKTRMQLEEASARTAAPGARHFQSFRSGLTHSVRTNGLHSLWRGTSAQILLGIPNAFNFPIYETLKHYALLYSDAASLSVSQVCLCSTITKVLLTFVTHPIAVVKTRLQDHRARVGEVKYCSFVSSLKTIWMRNGLANGFYRGMVPSLCHTVPRSVLMCVSYEYFLSVFLKTHT